jgi:hypothetical protein
VSSPVCARRPACPEEVDEVKKLLFLVAIAVAAVAVGSKDDIRRYLEMRRM